MPNGASDFAQVERSAEKATHGPSTRLLTQESEARMESSQHSLPFGRHKDQPLTEVPTDYLRWAIGECKLSSGLLTALTAELVRRGVEAPPPRARPPMPRCPRCGVDAGVVFLWQEDRAGRRRIRAECRRCRHYLAFAPCISPYVEQADSENPEGEEHVEQQ
jgi:hypothetical protein